MNVIPIDASFHFWPVCTDAAKTVVQVAIQILFIASSICITAVLAPCRVVFLPLTAVAASLLAATFNQPAPAG